MIRISSIIPIIISLMTASLIIKEHVKNFKAEEIEKSTIEEIVEDKKDIFEKNEPE